MRGPFRFWAGVWSSVLAEEASSWNPHGFERRSRHRTEALAVRAALRYSRALRKKWGCQDNALGWAGGVQKIGETAVRWYDAGQLATNWAAGIWSQLDEDPAWNPEGFVAWSGHGTRDLAKKAAIRYAKRLLSGCQPTGGALSWAGGVQKAGETTVDWYDATGRDLRKLWAGENREEGTGEK